MGLAHRYLPRITGVAGCGYVHALALAIVFAYAILTITVMKIRSKILGIYTFALVCVLVAITFITYPFIVNSHGLQSVRLFVITIIVVGLASMFLSSLLLEIIVVQRIGDLTRQVNHIKDYRSFYAKLKLHGGDEVAALATAINQMLDRIVGSTNEVSELNTELQEEKADQEKVIVERTKQLIEEKERLNASVSNLSLGFIMTDADNSVLLINERANVILTSITEPSDSPAAIAASPKAIWTIDEIAECFGDDFDLAKQLTASTRERKPAAATEVACGKHILRVLISPVFDEATDENLGSVILLEDITEQKVAERSRDEFFSIASHELRTPLTAIRGNTAMIKQFYVDQVKDDTFAEMVDDIHGASVRLIRIVNDFLDASRLEQGKIKFKLESFDLTEVLESVAYETTSLAAEKDNRIIIDKTLRNLPQVYADKDRVKQIVYNLVGNAMKFTSDGSITISGIKDGAMMKVLVTDTGPGISLENQNLLFHKFQQAGTDLFTRETSRGTGLGLYISKLLVESMGGSIALDHSELGKGTTFSFRLPLARTQ